MGGTIQFLDIIPVLLWGRRWGLIQKNKRGRLCFIWTPAMDKYRIWPMFRFQILIRRTWTSLMGISQPFALLMGLSQTILTSPTRKQLLMNAAFPFMKLWVTWTKYFYNLVIALRIQKQNRKTLFKIILHSIFYFPCSVSVSWDIECRVKHKRPRIQKKSQQNRLKALRQKHASGTQSRTKKNA